MIFRGKAKKKLSTSESFFVPKAGVEPARPKAHDFESSASTNSATQAFDERTSAFLANGLQICGIFLWYATGYTVINFSSENASVRPEKSGFTRFHTLPKSSDVR